MHFLRWGFLKAPFHFVAKISEISKGTEGLEEYSEIIERGVEISYFKNPKIFTTFKQWKFPVHT